MDMQGTPIGGTNQGTKNTSDPSRYTNPVSEGPGAIASDSLAAQSSTFKSRNDNAQSLTQTGSTSTFNNTDTNGATTIPPNASASQRADKETYGNGAPKGEAGPKYPEGVGGQYAGVTHGVTSDNGFVGGPSSERPNGHPGVYNTQNGSNAADGNAATAAGVNNGEPAPSYIASYYNQPSTETGSGKPHGKNLQEGGFDSSDANNASFNSDIGTDQDPGRVAENKFQRRAQESAIDVAQPREPGTGAKTEGGQYGILSEEQQL